ncbi:MAG: GLPGLI family protein [Bacteroidetes bacterium]|nr:GLPGLI family protein [Bacteroidota bacterium]
MKTILLFFGLIFIFTQSSFSQEKLNYLISYKGSISYSGPEKYNLTGTVIYCTKYSEWWHTVADNNNLLNNDTVQTIIPAKSKKSMHLFKDYESRRIIFEYNSSFIKSKNKENFYSDTLYGIVWNLSDEIKKIDTFDCYKATASFRGRNYVAWYAPSIAISEGPWKFGGLPGLILEIYDTSKVIHWKFESLSATKLLPEKVPTPRMDFTAFKREYKRGIDQTLQAMTANDQIDPSCSTCDKNVKMKINSIENLSD